MKTSEMKELGAEALAAKVRDAQAELADLKLKMASKAEVEKPVRMRVLRREIARMLTVLNAVNKESK